MSPLFGTGALLGPPVNMKKVTTWNFFLRIGQITTSSYHANNKVLDYLKYKIKSDSLYNVNYNYKYTCNSVK